MQWLIDLGLFALLFFLLVFSHELGHYLMARWVGIRVERFAIGMGPNIWSFKYGDTEYKLGILPIGGYVKMMGDDPGKAFSSEEQKYGFLSKSPPQKLLVVLGGPFFNFIFSFLILSVMLAFGVPTVEPVIGDLRKEMPALAAGLKSGDRVLQIDGEKVRKWNQVETTVQKAKDRELAFLVARKDLQTGEIAEKLIPVKPKLAMTKANVFGDDIEAGQIGVSPEYEVPQIYFISKDSLVAKAGFENGDRPVRLNQVSILTHPEFVEALNYLKPGDLTMEVERGPKKERITKTFSLPKGTNPVFERLGLYQPSLVIGHVEPNSPAERAGLKPFDMLSKIAGKPITAWDQVATTIRGSGGAPVDIEWIRDGKKMHANLAAEKNTINDPLMGKDHPDGQEAVYRIGIGAATKGEPVISVERSFNPLRWVHRGATESWNMMSLTVQAFYKLLTGALSVKMLGSPIMIYKVAGGTYRKAGGGFFGWFTFFTNLAMLSITLGLVNLFPIPILDGGHATFFTLEWIRGRPISLKVMERAMQVGLFMILALAAMVLYNDLVRYGWLDSVGRLFER